MSSDRISAGDKVRFNLNGKSIQGRVLEDRGPIGVNGRNLYRVRYELAPRDWRTSELTTDDIESTERSANARKLRELSNITPVKAVEKHSLFASIDHAPLLSSFLRDQGVTFTEDRLAIDGEVNFLIDKSILWDDFVLLLNEWKWRYSEGAL
jgi:hypothetical protein